MPLLQPQGGASSLWIVFSSLVEVKPSHTEQSGSHLVSSHRPGCSVYPCTALEGPEPISVRAMYLTKEQLGFSIFPIIHTDNSLCQPAKKPWAQHGRRHWSMAATVRRHGGDGGRRWHAARAAPLLLENFPTYAYNTPDLLTFPPHRRYR